MNEPQEGAPVARVIVAAITVLGATLGFVLGCELAIPLAKFQLRNYLGRVVAQDNASLNEAHTVLDSSRHSAFPPCSDAELSFFRDLVFHADYLRDAGRIHLGKVECSASASRPSQPIGQYKAGQALQNWTAAKGALIPIRNASLKTAGMQQEGFFVIFSSRLPDVQGPLRFHPTLNLAGGTAPQLPGQGPPVTSPGYATDNVTQQGDSIVAEHCSSVLSGCVTASVGVSDARRGEMMAVAGTSVVGGIAGAYLGIVLCAFRRRGRSLDQQLRRAIAAEELDVFYQPIVDFADGKIAGCEALARWTKPDGTPVSPDTFVQLAEENGFVGSLTCFVLKRTLKELEEAIKKIPDFRVNVNVSPADLVDPEFLPMLDQSMREAKLRPSSVVIEITERTTASHEKAMATIRDLRRMGHRIYIDDFGTGYSNLSSLLYPSIDSIKIDKAFIRAIGTDAVTVAIVPEILRMARKLSLGVVVEGIESQEQADYFSTEDIRMYGQGWLYGRPMPASDFLRLLGFAGQPKKTTVNRFVAATTGSRLHAVEKTESVFALSAQHLAEKRFGEAALIAERRFGEEALRTLEAKALRERRSRQRS
jgi:sensor c-di-GMP phosphodiesterase-like protein